MCAISPHIRARQQSLVPYKKKLSEDRAANLPSKTLIEIGCEETVAAKQFAEALKLQREKKSESRTRRHYIGSDPAMY